MSDGSTLLSVGSSGLSLYDSGDQYNTIAITIASPIINIQVA